MNAPSTKTDAKAAANKNGKAPDLDAQIAAAQAAADELAAQIAERTAALNALKEQALANKKAEAMEAAVEHNAALAAALKSGDITAALAANTAIREVLVAVGRDFGIKVSGSGTGSGRSGDGSQSRPEGVPAIREWTREIMGLMARDEARFGGSVKPAEAVQYIATESEQRFGKRYTPSGPAVSNSFDTLVENGFAERTTKDGRVAFSALDKSVEFAVPGNDVVTPEGETKTASSPTKNTDENTE